jgi:hypothetical protein
MSAVDWMLCTNVGSDYTYGTLRTSGFRYSVSQLRDVCHYGLLAVRVCDLTMCELKV